MKRVNALLNRSVPGKHDLNTPSADHRLFEHKPLDETQSSIRLVTLSSELAADGSIQCYISHSTLDRASYVCLSYRWGPSDDVVRIHINGAPFYLRRNVVDFLDLVRKMPMTFYWIDALCIDQANLAERNHQVAQMGQIFSKAFLVYIWLGKSLPMMPWIKHFVDMKQKHLADNPWTCIFEARETVKSCVFSNEYWSRAWVTQEILLARSVSILVCRESFKFHDLVGRMHYFDHIDFGSFRNCTFARFADLANEPDKLYPKTLINLLDRFRDKECEVPRDRIYSLLSLCSEFQLPDIDYNQTDEELAYDVLNRSDESLCVCSALLVAQTLCLSDRQQSEVDSPTYTSQSTFLDFDVKGLRYARHAMLCNDEILSWAHYKLMGTDIYGHDTLSRDFCPAFEILMDSLQAHTMNMNFIPPLATNGLASEPTNSPAILKMMTEEHRLAMLGGFGPALTITSLSTNPDISEISVSLSLLAELLPQPIQLCPRVVRRKEKTQEKHDEESAPMNRRNGSISAVHSDSQQDNIMQRKWSADLHRIDSATPSRRQEDEGAVSRLRLRRAPFAPG